MPEADSEPIFRCEFVTDVEVQARALAAVEVTRPRHRRAVQVSILELVGGLVIAFFGVLASRPPWLVLGVGLVALGGYHQYRCGASGMTKAFARAYAAMPSTGQPIRVDVFDDHLLHVTPTARGEWAWSHWEELWVSDEAVLLMTGRGMLFVPATSLSADDWLAFCSLARSKVPPQPS